MSLNQDFFFLSSHVTVRWCLFSYPLVCDIRLKPKIDTFHSIQFNMAAAIVAFEKIGAERDKTIYMLTTFRLSDFSNTCFLYLYLIYNFITKYSYVSSKCFLHF